MLSYTGTKGGMETYTRELYRELGTMDTGLEFVALASREGMRLDLSWFPGEVIASRISGENRVVWAAGELFFSAVWAARRRADLVHCPATLAPMWTPMPTVITIHDMLYWSHPEFMVTPLYTRPVKWMERRGAANAAHVITDSRGSADEIVRFLGFPDERLHVVPLAATAHRFADTPIRERENLLVASGQRRPYKNWDGLVRALALVDEQVRPRLVITGSADPAADPLLPVIAESGVEAWVEVRGWVTEQELTDLYQRARAMVMPTFAEGFGLPVLEAMAAGLPVLASDIPVLREVGGDAAVWFDPYDSASIAQAITVAATQPERLQAVVEEGVAQAARFSWARVASETLSVFRAALKESATERVTRERPR